MKFSEFSQYRPKTLPNVVVFVCEDDFLVEESRAVWVEILGANWRLEKLHAKDLDEREPGRLLDEARTPSLFAQSRLLLVANAEKLSKRWGEELVALQDVSNSSLKVILLSTGAKAPEDWMKKIPAIVIEPLKPGEVTRWLGWWAWPEGWRWLDARPDGARDHRRRRGDVSAFSRQVLVFRIYREIVA